MQPGPFPDSATLEETFPLKLDKHLHLVPPGSLLLSAHSSFLGPQASPSSCFGEQRSKSVPEQQQGAQVRPPSTSAASVVPDPAGVMLMDQGGRPGPVDLTWSCGAVSYLKVGL